MYSYSLTVYEEAIEQAGEPHGDMRHHDAHVTFL